MVFTSKSEFQCLQLSFYLKKSPFSSASISIYLSSPYNTTTLGALITTLDEDSASAWSIQRFTINASGELTISFVGVSSSYNDEVVAIDDVSLQDKTCDDDFVIVPKYSKILNTFSKGQFFPSPIMTSSEGYNFKLRVYPHGSTNATDGYMSIYFGIVEGPLDDDLEWPFSNKHVRIMITDQNDNPLYSMNRYQSFVSSQSHGEKSWSKPNSSEPVELWGYANFMNITDLKDKNNYLKHNSLMISVLIEDVAIHPNETEQNDARRIRLSNISLFWSLVLLLIIRR